MGLYRAAWEAIQEDGTRVVLRGREFGSLLEATRERDDAARAAYVAEAWIEASTWMRVPDDVVTSLEARLP